MVAAPQRLCGTDRRQGGQIFPLVLPLLVLLGVCLWWVLEAGVAVNEKRRLAQAADMAALSGAVWEARTLNFDAYMNRAIIANEAVIAQSVSLRSFLDYSHQLMQNSSVITQWIPYVGAALRVLERSWFGIQQAMGTALATTEAMLSLVDHDLAAAQRAMHQGARFAVSAIVRESVRNSDPRFEVTTGGQAALVLWQQQWTRFASFYGGAFRWRQQDVLYRSLDGFSAERQFRWPGSSAFGFRLERRGGTELIDFESWRALDTFSLHLRRYIIFGSLRERIPLGWGSASINQAGTRPPPRGSFAGARSVNPAATRLADLAYRPRAAYLGLPSLYDLSVAQREVFAPHSVLVRLRLPAPKRRGVFNMLDTAAAKLAASSDDNVSPSESGIDFFAEAAAAVWFARPVPRADGLPEQPSLYSPYWHARLESVSTEERLALSLADATPKILAGATP